MTPAEALRDVCRRFCGDGGHDDACVVLRAACAEQRPHRVEVTPSALPSMPLHECLDCGTYAFDAAPPLPCSGPEGRSRSAIELTDDAPPGPAYPPHSPGDYQQIG